MPPTLPLTDVKIKNLIPKEKSYKVFGGTAYIWRSIRMVQKYGGLNTVRSGNDSAKRVEHSGKNKTTFREVVEDGAGRFLVLPQSSPNDLLSSV